MRHLLASSAVFAAMAFSACKSEPVQTARVKSDEVPSGAAPAAPSNAGAGANAQEAFERSLAQVLSSSGEAVLATAVGQEFDEYLSAANGGNRPELALNGGSGSDVEILEGQKAEDWAAHEARQVRAAEALRRALPEVGQGREFPADAETARKAIEEFGRESGSSATTTGGGSSTTTTGGSGSGGTTETGSGDVPVEEGAGLKLDDNYPSDWRKLQEENLCVEGEPCCQMAIYKWFSPGKVARKNIWFPNGGSLMCCGRAVKGKYDLKGDGSYTQKRASDDFTLYFPVKADPSGDVIGCELDKVRYMRTGARERRVGLVVPVPDGDNLTQQPAKAFTATGDSCDSSDPGIRNAIWNPASFSKEVTLQVTSEFSSQVTTGAELSAEFGFEYGVSATAGGNIPGLAKAEATASSKFTGKVGAKVSASLSKGTKETEQKTEKETLTTGAGVSLQYEACGSVQQSGYTIQYTTNKTFQADTIESGVMEPSPDTKIDIEDGNFGRFRTYFPVGRSGPASRFTLRADGVSPFILDPCQRRGCQPESTVKNEYPASNTQCNGAPRFYNSLAGTCLTKYRAGQLPAYEEFRNKN